MIQPGTVIHDRYEVIKKLGNGNFGQTFEVSDRLGVPQGEAGTPKVLKVLNLSPLSDPETKEQGVRLFQQEARTLQQLNHPGIPQVAADCYFRFVPQDSPEALHCLVMEKLPGQDLKSWLTHNKPIGEEQAIDWLKQLVEILDTIHKNDFFHRDIKPSNIMVIRDDQLALIDFGAVREVTETFIQRQQNNQSGTKIRSNGYTPPEQADGRAIPQSDFFALGHTFVHLLTGKHPLDIKQDSKTGKLIWRDEAVKVSEDLAYLIDLLIDPYWRKRPQSTEVILQEINAIEGATGGVYSPWSSLQSVLSVVFNFILLGLLARRMPLTEGMVWFLFVVAVVIAISIFFPVLFRSFSRLLK